MALVLPGNGGGEGVSLGRRDQGMLIHSLTEGGGMPLATCTTPASGDERAQVMPPQQRCTCSSTVELSGLDHSSQRCSSKGSIPISQMKDPALPAPPISSLLVLTMTPWYGAAQDKTLLDISALHDYDRLACLPVVDADALRSISAHVRGA
jgi:hypothetical protein